MQRGLLNHIRYQFNDMKKIYEHICMTCSGEPWSELELEFVGAMVGRKKLKVGLKIYVKSMGSRG